MLHVQQENVLPARFPVLYVKREKSAAGTFSVRFDERKELPPTALFIRVLLYRQLLFMRPIFNTAAQSFF